MVLPQCDLTAGGICCHLYLEILSDLAKGVIQASDPVNKSSLSPDCRLARKQRRFSQASNVCLRDVS